MFCLHGRRLEPMMEGLSSTLRLIFPSIRCIWRQSENGKYEWAVRRAGLIFLILWKEPLGMSMLHDLYVFFLWLYLQCIFQFQGSTCGSTNSSRYRLDGIYPLVSVCSSSHHLTSCSSSLLLISVLSHLPSPPNLSFVAVNYVYNLLISLTLSHHSPFFKSWHIL